MAQTLCASAGDPPRARAGRVRPRRQSPRPRHLRRAALPRCRRGSLQQAQLAAAGASKVFGETAPGARSDRAQLKRVVAVLVEGDVLAVTCLNVRRSRGFGDASEAKLLR